MFQKVFLLVLTLIASVSLMHEGFASVTYTPALNISLTGSTNDVRFDVASPLSGTSFSGAYLDTTTKKMSGAFYINNIGWALMLSGSFQVGLNCSSITDLKDILPTTSQCQFTGSGWSENIGEIGFANVLYNPSTATLSGSITSFAGDFSVEGTYLPLIKATLNESLVGITADHVLSYSIKDSERYVADNAWSMQVLPSKNSTYFRTISGGGVGVFNSVDLSLADTYTFSITDPDGGVTEYSGIVVSPADASTTLDTTSGLFVKDFCDHNSSNCPDGSTRIATTHIRHSSGPVIADGVDAYNMILNIRDKYGNRVTSGNVEISYTGTVSEIQLPSRVIMSPYASFGDTLRIGGIVVPYDGTGNWKSFPIGLTHTDILYTVSSIAPTDASDNRVILDKIVYTDMVGTTTTIYDTTPLVFDPAYTTTITPPTDIQIGESSTFTGNFTAHTSEGLNPEIVGLFEIGNGFLAEYKNFSSTIPLLIETSPDNNWMIQNFPSSLNLSGITPSFAFSGIYMPRTAFPEIERVYYDLFIHYRIGITDIVYPVFSGNKIAEYNNSRVKILGQNNARGEYGTIGTNSNVRTSFVNKLRKNIALMNRGRTTYDDVKYKVVTGTDTSITNTVFNNHQTIIAIGEDITITQDITKRDKPLAIIALVDESGNGGNIIIAPNVKEISVGLFAERAVRSTGDKQLYIYGTVVSGNTFGDTAAGICPYYVVSCTNPADFDLEHLRTYDGTDPTKASSNPRASEYTTPAIIIEYDMQLQMDPPPGIPK